MDRLEEGIHITIFYFRFLVAHFFAFVSLATMLMLVYYYCLLARLQ